MGQGQKFRLGAGPGWVNCLLLRSYRVSHLWIGFRKFPLKVPTFLIFPFGVKTNFFWSGQKVPGTNMTELDQNKSLFYWLFFTILITQRFLMLNN